MSRIQCPPPIAEVNLEPGAKIHGKRCCGDADVAEITAGVTGRNIESAAEGNC